MFKLFIDTATQQGSIALYNDEVLLSETIFNDRLRHLKILHSEIDKILLRNRIEVKDINLIGVDIGPGSFTGIRIGVTTARTLAQLNNSYIEGITSLDLLSKKITVADTYICPLLDAKKNRVFTTLFFNEKRIIDYMDIPVIELIEKIKNINTDKDIVFLGDGLIKYKDILQKKFNKAVFKDEGFYFPEAKYMNRIIKEISEYNDEYESVKPFYIRKSDAEENQNLLNS